jgi:hypothetical protein
LKWANLKGRLIVAIDWADCFGSITGDVEILERFWKTEAEKQPEELAPPLLVYADLLATGNQRNLETAKMIYEQNIVRLIRED